MCMKTLSYACQSRGHSVFWFLETPSQIYLEFEIRLNFEVNQKSSKSVICQKIPVFEQLRNHLGNKLQKKTDPSIDRSSLMQDDSLCQ